MNSVLSSVRITSFSSVRITSFSSVRTTSFFKLSWIVSILSAQFAIGCASPLLDRTGVIRCGADRVGGGCPPSWTCRFDRCCPPGSTNDSCPLNVETDGSVKCSANRECPMGLSCRFDRCCPESGGTGLCSPQRIGAPCENNNSCGAGLNCFRERPQIPFRALGGYCVRLSGCNPMDPNACGDGNVCVNGDCFARCIVPPNAEASMMRVPCRTDHFGAAYSCRRISFDAASTDGACLPDCRGPVDGMSICAGTTMCDMASGDCTNRCAMASECPSVQYDCENNQCEPRFIGCGSDAECNTAMDDSRVCVPRPGWPDQTVKVCALRRASACVDGFLCAQPRRTDAGTFTFPCVLGACLVRFTPIQ